MPEIHGHRGARALRPENTLPGLAYALAIGVDAIEFDVTLTADDTLILVHDLTVDPAIFGGSLSGQRWRDLTLDQIATLDAGAHWLPPPYQPVRNTPVPTLEQVCALVGSARRCHGWPVVNTGLSTLGQRQHARRSAVTLAVELKTNPSWPARDVEQLTEMALRTLTRHGLTGQARILAFDWRVLAAAARLAPRVQRVALVEPATWIPSSPWLAGHAPAAPSAHALAGAARAAGAAWLSPDDRMTTPDVIMAARAAGLRVAVWTVNDPARCAELAMWSVDGIVTDRPDVVRAVFAGLGYCLPDPAGMSLCTGAAGNPQPNAQRCRAHTPGCAEDRPR